MLQNVCSHADIAVPYSYQTFAGGAAGISLAVSIPFLLRAHVSLYTDYDQYVGTYDALLVEGTHYNWVSDTLITTLASTVGRVITVKRKTPTTALLVGWADGSNVDMDDLLTADRQNLYAVQEQEDASSLVTATAGLALSQVAASLPYTAVATVAGITATPNDKLRVEIADSTGVQSFSPLTGRPSGFVGASNLIVRLVYTTTGNTWQWLDYRATNPDDRYGTIASVTAVSTAAAAAQTTANTASTAAAAAQTTANTKAPTASPTFTGTVTIPAGASISGFAPLASPTFTGTPAAPTATAGANTTQLATTAFVTAATAFTQDGTGAVQRTVAGKLKEVYSLKDFGAVGDGTTNDRAALVAALAAVKARGGGTLFVPRGTYLISKGSVFPDCNIEIVGDGPTSTIFRYQDESTNVREDFLTTVNSSTVVQTWDIALRNLTLQSGLGSGSVYSVCSHIAQFSTSGNVVIENCNFLNSRYMGTVVSYAKSLTVSNCQYRLMAADGIHSVGCDNINVTGSYFYRVADDSINVGRLDVLLTENNANSRQTVVSNNNFEESGGICATGVKHIAITSNTFNKTRCRAIEVGADANQGVEGSTTQLSILIANNVIDTVFTPYGLGDLDGGDSAKYIYVFGQTPSALPTGGYVGLANGTGGVNQPFPYFYTTNTDNNAPATGAWYVVIANNVCTRTLAPTSAWTNYGVGQFFVGHGQGFTNPVVDYTDLVHPNQAGIKVEGSMYHAIIDGNLLSNLNGGIEFFGAATGIVLWDDIVIRNNEISNFAAFGIKHSGLGSFHISSNLIDGDPYHIHPARTSGGTWGTGFDGYFGIWCPDASTQHAGVICQNNTFRNIGYDYQSDNTKVVFLDNIYMGYPKFPYSDPTNIGIRAWNSGKKTWVIADDNPSSSNFKRVLNTCYSSYYQLPASGYYLKNTVVYKDQDLNVAGTSGSQYILIGWVRLTNGSGHVLNTDWKEIRSLTGT